MKNAPQQARFFIGVFSVYWPQTNLFAGSNSLNRKDAKDAKKYNKYYIPAFPSGRPSALSCLCLGISQKKNAPSREQEWTLRFNLL